MAEDAVLALGQAVPKRTSAPGLYGFNVRRSSLDSIGRSRTCPGAVSLSGRVGVGLSFWFFQFGLFVFRFPPFSGPVDFTSASCVTRERARLVREALMRRLF